MHLLLPRGTCAGITLSTCVGRPGVAVDKVLERDMAHRCGLREGDCIVAMNGVPYARQPPGHTAPNSTATACKLPPTAPPPRREKHRAAPTHTRAGRCRGHAQCVEAINRLSARESTDEAIVCLVVPGGAAKPVPAAGGAGPEGEEGPGGEFEPFQMGADGGGRDCAIM